MLTSHPNPWDRAVSTPSEAQSRPRRLENADPRPLLRSLNRLLDSSTQRIPDFLDVDHLIALYERDIMEREDRDMLKAKARRERARDRSSSSNLTVFGSSLRETTLYASTITVLSGFEHDIPIIVFRCVKELCRHGCVPHKRAPDRHRLLALITAFDAEPQFGCKTAFKTPSEIPEVYGLLTTYLFALPEPLISSDIFEALWTWCIMPSLRNTDLKKVGHRRTFEPTDSSIRICQILLRLLSIPSFSLVVYLMGLFQRLPNLISDDIGRAVLAGAGSKADPASDGRGERVSTMLQWLVDRWDVIVKALFDGPDTSSVSRLSRAPTKKNDNIEDDDNESDVSSASSCSALEQRLQDFTRELAEEAQRELKRRNRQATMTQTLPAESKRSSKITQDNDSGYDSSEDTNLHVHEAAPPSPPQCNDDQELTHPQALRRISLLERELERSDHAVEEAITKTFQAQSQIKELEARLRVYEGRGQQQNSVPRLELRLDDKRATEDWHAILHSDTDTLKRQLAETQKERDKAVGLVQEMKELIQAHGF
ncbi:Rho-GAP domain-containing protein [Mycena indigotica]|uniref:Rho-GAP domain-containing protein n=1 Tax=Mycena indigotica TaxID=2126181 RepID=A0A8H6WCP3_9AGAR|nr:Rho-GAP domain-containing protein [Mycena indigotica]KAF7309948.1 Rho-GAP domain-containing protein [Mycena indigotica]